MLSIMESAHTQNVANLIIDVHSATSLDTEHIIVGKQKVQGTAKVTTTMRIRIVMLNTNGKNSKGTVTHWRAIITTIKTREAAKTID